MLTIDDYYKYRDLDFDFDFEEDLNWGKDLDYAAKLRPKKEVFGLPTLQIIIKAENSQVAGQDVWSWEWRSNRTDVVIVPPATTPTVVAGRRSQVAHSSIGEAAEAAIASVDHYIETELSHLEAARKEAEQKEATAKEREARIQRQINDFFGDVY